MNIEATVGDTLMEVSPFDVNVDSDGFTNFNRSYPKGTVVSVTAPPASEGHRFLRWSLNGVMQEYGVRAIDVTVSEDTALRAYYQRPARMRPDLPTEDSGDME